MRNNLRSPLQAALALLLLCPAFRVEAQPGTNGFCLRDDVTGDFVLFDGTTGSYEFTSCSDGRTFKGQGSVSESGCLVRLGDWTNLRDVSVVADRCTHNGAASYVVGATVTIVSLKIQDTDFSNSVCSCQILLNVKGTYECKDPEARSPTIIVTTECGVNCKKTGTYTTSDGAKFNCTLTACDGCKIE